MSTYVPQVAPPPNEQSELIFGQFPPKVKHSCKLLGAVASTALLIMLTFNTPVALVMSKLTRGVTELPLSVAAVTLPLQPRPEGAAAAAATKLSLKDVMTSPRVMTRLPFHQCTVYNFLYKDNTRSWAACE
jgi:hypothetical protein